MRTELVLNNSGYVDYGRRPVIQQQSAIKVEKLARPVLFPEPDAEPKDEQLQALEQQQQAAIKQVFFPDIPPGRGTDGPVRYTPLFEGA